MDMIRERGEEGIVNRNNNHSSFKLWGLLLLTLFILILPTLSAVEVSMNSQFSQGETLLAVFSGNFVDQITENNVFFERDTGSPIPLVLDVVKINNDFYVYALLTNVIPGNYSLTIEGVRYYQATQIIDEDIVSNFTISDSTSDFSISPGAIMTSTSFSVELQNLQDKRITVEINTESSVDSQSSIELNTGEKKTFSFTLNSQSVKGLTYIEFSSGNTSYSLPVYLDTTIESEEEAEKDFAMEFQPRTAEVSLATDSETKRILYLKNTGSETIEDVYFTISPALEPYVVISPETIDKINPGDNEKIEITIISDLEEAIIEGRIIAHAENITSSLTLTLEFIKDFVPEDEEEGEEPTILATCEDLNGNICADGLKCTGNTERAKNGICCILPATCEEPKKSSTGRIVGWGLIVLVILFVFWFFKRKYRGVSRKRPF
jgi:archaellum component FlaG (FlaF/FlaG flagellin family)